MKPFPISIYGPTWKILTTSEYNGLHQVQIFLRCFISLKVDFKRVEVFALQTLPLELCHKRNGDEAPIPLQSIEI